jgi:hypothetical protein
MRNKRFTASGREKASREQIETIRELAERAGYTGDCGYNAARDLLGDGRHWSGSPDRAEELIEALRHKLGETA